MRDVQALAEQLIGSVEQVIYGKREVVKHTLVAMLANGHVLLEDVPGVGKTMLAKALAKALGGTFKRVQFTPDLLPADITGVTLYDQHRGEFRFRPGPAFTNVLLADEINRASPKTQSALLESMAEKSLTVDGQTYELPRPFLVVATQNPVEMEGVYPLPEAQIDRFMMKLQLGYPGRVHERELLCRPTGNDPTDGLTPVAGPETFLECQRLAAEVRLDDQVRDYLLDLVEASRAHEHVRLGASPRAAQALASASRALALIEGRDYVRPDDVHQLAVPILAHRLLLLPTMASHPGAAPQLVMELLSRIKAP